MSEKGCKNYNNSYNSLTSRRTDRGKKLEYYYHKLLQNQEFFLNF